MFINFLETFFFLSLGIAFVLILLIVYHFKQQIAAIEQKSDTLFDIIQNLAKELTSLKTQQHTNHSNMPIFFSSNDENLGNIPMFQPPIRLFNPSGVEEFKDEEEVEFCDDDEDMDDEDDDEYDDEKDSDNDSGSILYTGEEYEDFDETEVYKKIKVDDGILEGEQVTNLEEVLEELVLDEELQDESQIQEMDINMDDNIDTTNLDMDEDHKETPSVNTESYKRMNLTALKTIALSRGIQVDMSKMKKNDLIKLLQ